MPVEQNSDEAMLLDRREEPGAVAAMIKRLSKSGLPEVRPQLAVDMSVEDRAETISDETGCDGSSSEIIVEDDEVVPNAS